jgi:hypothetical protein
MRVFIGGKDITFDKIVKVLDLIERNTPIKKENITKVIFEDNINKGIKDCISNWLKVKVKSYKPKLIPKYSDIAILIDSQNLEIKNILKKTNITILEVFLCKNYDCQY